MEKDLSKLEKTIGVNFANKDLLKQALVHRSYLNEHPKFGLPNNERLEFLGDAVLELVVTDYLYHNYDSPEGELTNWRASLVSGVSCADVANNLALGKYLYLSKGEAKDKNLKARNYILANALEALIGSIYLDKGYKTTEKFINKHVLNKLSYILDNKLYIDPKTYFQERAQEKEGVTPVYKVLSESGPDHNKTFKIGVYLGNNKIAEGKGSSKQEAQVKAAAEALEIKSW